MDFHGLGLQYCSLKMPLCAGTLFKKRDYLGGWRPRFFVLTSTELCYWLSESDYLDELPPRGTATVGESMCLDRGLKRPFSFCISNADGLSEPWRLHAESGFDFDRWFDALVGFSRPQHPVHAPSQMSRLSKNISNIDVTRLALELDDFDENDDDSGEEDGRNEEDGKEYTSCVDAPSSTIKARRPAQKQRESLPNQPLFPSSATKKSGGSDLSGLDGFKGLLYLTAVTISTLAVIAFAVGLRTWYCAGSLNVHHNSIDPFIPVVDLSKKKDPSSADSISGDPNSSVPGSADEGGRVQELAPVGYSGLQPELSYFAIGCLEMAQALGLSPYFSAVFGQGAISAASRGTAELCASSMLYFTVSFACYFYPLFLIVEVLVRLRTSSAVDASGGVALPRRGTVVINSSQVKKGTSIDSGVDEDNDDAAKGGMCAEISESPRSDSSSLPALKSEMPLRFGTFRVPARFEQLTNAAVEELLRGASCGASDGWRLNGSRKDGVQCYLKDGDFAMAKGSAMLPFPPRAVFDLVMLKTPDPRVTRIDPDLASITLVEELNAQTRIDHFLYKAVWPTAARDFCILSHWRVLENGTIAVVGISIEDPRVPPTKGNVRGRVLQAGWLIEPVVDAKPGLTGSRVTMTAQIDLNGMPGFVLKLIMSSQPMQIASLARLLDGRDKKFHSQRFEASEAAYERMGPLRNPFFEE